MLKLLDKLVAIPSPYPHEHQLSDFVAQYVERLGCDVQRIPTGDRNNLIVTTKESPHYLGFYTHLDTMPPAEDCSVDPYELIVAGDVASGLGVCDSKGGMVAILEALEFAVKEGYPLKVVFCVDHQNYSQGAYDVIETGLLSDIDFLIFSEIGHAIDFNSKFSVVFGRNGRRVFDINITSLHAWDHPESAVFQAARFISQIKRLEEQLKERGDQAIVVMPDALKADKRGQPVAGSTCYVRCNISTTPSFGEVEFRAWVEEQTNLFEGRIDVRLHERPTPYLEAYQVDRNHEFVRCLEEELIRPHGVVPTTMPSVADENVFAAHGIPVVTIGAIGGGGHSSSEWIN
ncbi:MAG: M20/M25/M40 family metallo-hydrolase, partial [Bdellovibrionales bacterium]|nr:M20/M25/M40 family metallo-hydrolase [Bdellovibrionales bacterium]